MHNLNKNLKIVRLVVSSHYPNHVLLGYQGGH
jgi:hypothetical protein